MNRREFIRSLLVGTAAAAAAALPEAARRILRAPSEGEWVVHKPGALGLMLKVVMGDPGPAHAFDDAPPYVTAEDLAEWAGTFKPSPWRELFSPDIKYVQHEAPHDAAPRVLDRDLAEWSSPPLPGAGPWTLARVEYYGFGGFRFVAVGDAGQVIESVDGETWSGTQPV